MKEKALYPEWMIRLNNFQNKDRLKILKSLMNNENLDVYLSKDKIQKRIQTFSDVFRIVNRIISRKRQLEIGMNTGMVY